MTKEDGKPYHDPETGLFTYPEPIETDTSNFRPHAVEMPDGEKKNILIPPAGLKPSRVFFAVVNGVNQSWAVEETVEEIKAAKDHAMSKEPSEWYKFTDPVFGRELHVDCVSMQNVHGIMEDMTDLQKVRDNITREEYEKAEFAKQSLQMLGRTIKH